MVRLRRALAALALPVGLLVLACASRPPATPDDGWSPNFAPLTSVDAGAEPSADVADASVEDLTAAFQQRVTLVGPRHWQIRREAIDLLRLREGDLVLRAMRIVPEAVDGSIVGLRIFGIRANGVAAAIGLQNGDRLETINGVGMASPTQALASYAALLNARHVELVVMRAGQLLTLTYDIVDGSP